MMINTIMRICVPLFATVLAACGGGSSSVAPPSNNPDSADIRILMMGNSHTEANNLPGMLAAMLRAARPGKAVSVTRVPEYGFLEDHFKSATSMAQFNSQRWTAVILQAQKYSTSGQFEYSTFEAEELVRMARARSAIPVMFPEWPRRAIDETQRIYDLHVRIAAAQEACVAPIGQAWDLSGVRGPGINLWADDDNHARAPGSFLTALILFGTLTGESPLNLPNFAFSVEPAAQTRLREVADEQLRLIAGRKHCPNTGRI